MFVFPVCGYDGERWPQIPQHRRRRSTTGQRGWLLLGFLLLSKRRSNLSGSWGEKQHVSWPNPGSVLCVQGCWRLLWDLLPGWLARNQSADEKGGIPWLIKDTQMNNLSPLTVCVWIIPVASALFIFYLFAVWSLSYRDISWRQSCFIRRNKHLGWVLLLHPLRSSSSIEIDFTPELLCLNVQSHPHLFWEHCDLFDPTVP